MIHRFHRFYRLGIVLDRIRGFGGWVTRYPQSLVLDGSDQPGVTESEISHSQLPPFRSSLSSNPVKLTLLVCLICAICGANPSVPEPVKAKSGMVVSSSEVASRVGVEIMKKGGNAVDAAVATGLALAVTHPAAGNIGGGGFMLVRMVDGKSVAIDFRETAPAAAFREMYLDRNGNVVPRASLVGHLAVGVPGTVAGFALAQEKFGKLKWADVVEPARRLAADGIAVSEHLSRSLATTTNLKVFPETKRVYLNSGKYWERGQAFIQPDLAETLKRLRDEGPREFYEGQTAKLIVDEMQSFGGLIALDDLKGYKAVVREPLHGTYRGYEIVTMPPPSSGGIALIEMLNILERYDLARMDAGARAHLEIEAMRRAFADRAEFLGDPDFVKVPGRGLTSKKYAAEIAKSIDAEKAGTSEKVGHGAPAAYESSETTHYTVVDSSGNVASTTYTLNGGFGSGVTVHGAGFLLNNEMDDFTSKPGVPNLFGLIQGEANAIGPKKRPLSSMTPTIVLKDGKPWMVIGSPGGPTIINTVLEVILNAVDDGMNIRQAIEAPRMHHQWLPDLVNYEKGVPLAVLDALKARGHVLASRPVTQGEAHGIVIDFSSGMRLGYADKRMPDSGAVGY